MLIGAFGIFFSIHGPYVASFYEITFSRRPLREEREIRVEQPFPTSLALKLMSY